MLRDSNGTKLGECTAKMVIKMALNRPYGEYAECYSSILDNQKETGNSRDTYDGCRAHGSNVEQAT